MKPQICKGGFVVAIVQSQNNSCFDFITCTSESHITLWKVLKVDYSTLSIFVVHKFQVEGPILNLVASDNIIGFTLDKAIFLCKVVVQTNGEVDISKITHSNDQSHLTSVTEEVNLKLKHQISTTRQQKSTVNQNMINNNGLMTGNKSKQTPVDNIKPTSLGKIRKYKDNWFAEKIFSNKPIKKSEATSYKELCTFNFEESKAFEEKSISTTNEVLLSEKYVWPFAPDCFIPNSVVRSFRKPAYPFIDHLTRITNRLSKQDNVPEEIDFENDFEFSDNDNNYQVTNTKTFSFLSGIKEQISRPDKHDGIFVEKRKLRDDTSASEKKKTRQNVKSVIDNTKVKKRNKVLTKRIPKNEVMNQSFKAEIESASLSKKLPTPQIEIESVSLTECVPPPYDEYTDKEWFPRDIGYDQNFVISYLINQLNTSQPLVFKEILAAITKIHGYNSMSNELFEKFIQILLSYLENPSGQIRHYAVSAFLALSPNRRDVLLKLIPKLNDPIDPVKDAVKRLLNEMKIIANIRESQNSLSPKHKSKIENNDNALKKNLSDSNQNKLQVINNKLTKKSDSMYPDLEGNEICDVKNKYKSKVKVKSALKDVNKTHGNFNNENSSATKRPNHTVTTNIEPQNDNSIRLLTINRSSQDISIKVFDKSTPSYRSDGSIISEEHRKLEIDGRIIYNDTLRVTKLGPYKEEKILLSKLLGLFKDEDIWHLNRLLHENIQETTEHLATNLANKLYKRFESLKSNPRLMPKFITNSFSKTLQVESNEELQSSLDVNISKSFNTSCESYIELGPNQMVEKKKQLETLGANKTKRINKKKSKLIEISSIQINNFDTQMNKPESIFFNDTLNLPMKSLSDSFSFEENKSNDQACCFYKTTYNLDKRNESESQISFEHATPNNRDKTISVKQIKSLFKVPPSIKKGNKLASKAPLFNNETQNKNEEKKHVSLFKAKKNKVLLPEISFNNTINKLNSDEKKKKVVLASSLTDNKNLSSNQISEYEINNCSADNISMLLNFLRKGHGVKKKERLSLKLKKTEKLLNIKNTTVRSESLLFTLEEAEQMLRKLNSLQKLTYKTFQSGVCGERILCRLETIASNYKYETITKVIESLPERYGCQIVSVDSGITMYGPLSFYWKSLCNTDLSLNYHQSDPTRNKTDLLTVDNKFYLKPCFLRL
ncbi:uncharacterized protein LOC100211484 isoform X12 [Hydra vulgaris]|uniref:Uncharacterized protein LOC100211484 isoform X12 n=1 Tax=Hydra vulgaris TaxID=6087 RepID=A0ABM4D4Q5_HYDVU